MFPALRIFQYWRKMVHMSQLPLEFPIREARDREDFFVAPCNAPAVKWLDSYPDWPMPGLVIYGPEGAGKSHLAAIFSATTDCLVCEDIDRARDDEALLHDYNAAAESGRHILFTSRALVDSFVLLPDLLSRLKSCPAITIELPDDDFLSALLVKQMADRQLPVDPDVVRYAVTNGERSFKAVRDLVRRLDALSLAQKRRLTIPLIREVLNG